MKTRTLHVTVSDENGTVIDVMEITNAPAEQSLLTVCIHGFGEHPAPRNQYDHCSIPAIRPQCSDDCDLSHCPECGSHMMGGYLAPGTRCTGCQERTWTHEIN